MKQFRENVGSFLIIFIIVCFITGCNTNEYLDSSFCYFYNDAEYVLEDPFGGHINSQWQFPELNMNDTSRVKIYFGPENDIEKKPNHYVKKFNNKKLNMLLIEWGDLLCKKGYLLNYHDVENIESIYVVQRKKNYDVDFWDSNVTCVDNYQDANDVFKELKEASESGEWYRNSSPELESRYELGEIHIGLKFYDVVAIYDMGYINMTESGRWGLYLYDTQPYELYLLSDATVQCLLQ